MLIDGRFAAVKKRFMFELRELRTREQTQVTNPCVISLLMGMKFFRVKVTCRRHSDLVVVTDRLTELHAFSV